MSAAETKKTYYVIAREHQNRFAPAEGGDSKYPWVETPQESKQYATLAAVVTAYPVVNETHKGGYNYLPDLDIVRIDVTPAQQTVAAANDIDGLIDGKRPVALYNVRKQLYVRYDSVGYLTYDTIEKAHVFADLAAVLKFNFPRTSVGLPEDIEVHQVVAHTIPEKVTETILK